MSGGSKMQRNSVEIEERLQQETEKWIAKLEQVVPTIKASSAEEKDVVKNIVAYIEDSRYFSEEQDWIRAFEACIWAWAFYEASFKFNKE
jgi:uncharacterized protein